MSRSRRESSSPFSRGGQSQDELRYVVGAPERTAFGRDPRDLVFELAHVASVGRPRLLELPRRPLLLVELLVEFARLFLRLAQLLVALAEALVALVQALVTVLDATLALIDLLLRSLEVRVRGELALALTALPPPGHAYELGGDDREGEQDDRLARSDDRAGARDPGMRTRSAAASSATSTSSGSRSPRRRLFMGARLPARPPPRPGWEGPLSFGRGTPNGAYSGVT